MAKVMTNSLFVAKQKDIAKNYKTLYVNGCFGAPLTSSTYTRYLTNTSYNRKPTRQEIIKAHTNTNPITFGFDCVCLIKGILWGWSGNKNKAYGGAQYAVNGVPDVGTEEIINYCSGVSSTFDVNTMYPGELLWLSGHVGIYIGNGLAVECTPAWDDCVQFSCVGNIGAKPGYNCRSWAKHGRLPWIDYTVKSINDSPAYNPAPESPSYTKPEPAPASPSYTKPEPAPAPETTGGTKTVNVTMPVLKKGMKVDAVRTLQRILRSLGYTGTDGNLIEIDGSFGGSTNKAVGNFQSKNGLNVDYSVGQQTWTKLLSGDCK